jgi:hypothetical protein
MDCSELHRSAPLLKDKFSKITSPNFYCLGDNLHEKQSEKDTRTKRHASDTQASFATEAPGA